MAKNKKRRRPQVERAEPTLPWEMAHPRRGHEGGQVSGKARERKYPIATWCFDPIDFRLPGSFESRKER